MADSRAFPLSFTRLSKTCGRTISNGCSSAARSRTRDDFVVDLGKATAEILSFQNRARKPADHSPHWEDLVSFWKSLGTTVDTAEVKHVRHFRHFLTHRRGRFAQGEPDEVLGALADVAGRAWVTTSDTEPPTLK